MAGEKNSKLKLNNTLKKIVYLLNINNIDNWFIGYGTLLGIIRENSCIDGDDDIDIIIDSKYFEKINLILKNNNFKTTKNYGINNTKKIIKTIANNEYTSIDFYCAYYDDNTKNFNDSWEKVIWTRCKDENNNFILKKWNDVELHIPLNYEEKIYNRYGEKWKIPINTKGPMPRKKQL